MSQASYVKLVGEWPKILAEEGYALVEPSQINVNYDIMPLVGKMSPEDNPETMLQLYQIAAEHPLLSQRFDLVAMYTSLARRMGERNIASFKLDVGVMDDVELQNRVADGELEKV